MANFKTGQWKLFSQRKRKIKQRVRPHGTPSRGPNTYHGSHRRETEVEKMFEEIMAENFPNLMKDMDINIQEVQ